MVINYTKMHGLKNDFIIIDGRKKKEIRSHRATTTGQYGKNANGGL